MDQASTLMNNAVNTITVQGIAFGQRLLGALLVWVVGGFFIGLLMKALESTLGRRNIDATLKRYIESISSVLLKVMLLLAVLSVLGIETTSFAALLAAAGLAIGAALSGLLANFAAGIFMLVLKPFKVGDFINAGDVTGTVKELGLFVTAIDTPDNVRTYVGNNKVFSGNLKNYTANPFRRVELEAQLPHGIDPRGAIALLKAELKRIPNTQGEPVVEIVRFTLAGPVLAVFPFCHNDYYWDVYFATNQAIVNVCTAAGYPVPEQHWHVRQQNVA